MNKKLALGILVAVSVMLSFAAVGQSVRQQRIAGIIAQINALGTQGGSVTIGAVSYFVQNVGGIYLVQSQFGPANPSFVAGNELSTFINTVIQDGGDFDAEDQSNS